MSSFPFLSLATVSLLLLSLGGTHAFATATAAVDLTAGVSDSDLAAAFARETGLRTLIRKFEIAHADLFQKPCRRMYSESGGSGQEEAEAESLPYCVTPDVLRLTRSKLVNFEEFTEEAAKMHGNYHRSVRMENIFGRAWPYLSGGLPRRIADGIQETKTNFNWVRFGAVKADRLRYYLNFTTLQNRSLLYWSLNQFRQDIKFLKLWLETGRITTHFFIITHNQDRPGYPQWLLDHPLVLKVFGHHIPAHIRHPKLVPIPLGLDPVKVPTALQEIRASLSSSPRHSKVFQPTRLLSSRFAMKLGSLRPIIAEALNRNFPGRISVKKQLSRREYYKEVVFIVSPVGIGFESAKSWEALYLGRLPLISDSFRNDSFFELPTVTVGDYEWDRVTPEALEATWDRFMADKLTRYNLDRMWCRWWLTYILRICLSTP